MMKRGDDYRSRAAEALRLAIRARCITEKSTLLGMAEAWLELADRANEAIESPMRDPDGETGQAQQNNAFLNVPT